MPTNRRLCSLASGIVTIFFCLSFVVDQLDPRRGLINPEINSISEDTPKPQPLLTLWNMTPNIQAQSSHSQARGFSGHRQTTNYYTQDTRGYNFQSQRPRYPTSFQAHNGPDLRQTSDSYTQGSHDSKPHFHPQRPLNFHQQPSFLSQGLESYQHVSNSQPLPDYRAQRNSQSREPRHLASPSLTSSSHSQGFPEQANSQHMPNSQVRQPFHSAFSSSSTADRSLNAQEPFHTSSFQSQDNINPMSYVHGYNSQTQPHDSQGQTLEAQRSYLEALQESSLQAQSQFLATDQFQTRPQPYPRSITPTTPILIPGFELASQESSNPLEQPSQPSKPSQPPSKQNSAFTEPVKSTPSQSSTNIQSPVNGQCKTKYWKCDSPPTDPEPPLEDLQELEDLPGHPFSAPHWSQYANRGYTVVDRNESSSKQLPHVLIIGAKKSGTRALLAFLRVHPSIKASGPELHYFDRFYARGLQWYRSKLPLSLEGQLTVEKTPAYFTTPGVPARVKQDLPDAKLLLVVRDPVTRALSDYTQSLSKHRSRRPFEELAFVRASPGLVNSEWGPISGGLYARHLQRWLDYFPRPSIHVVSGENLIRDPAAELCKVQEFLGLRRVITEKHFFFNVTKGFPCLVKREKTGKPHCLGSSKGRSHPRVSQATLTTLRDFYRPFNFKFYKMVGQNFRW